MVLKDKILEILDFREQKERTSGMNSSSIYDI